MVTWTTYGTWLQGDKRGYVKDGQVLEGDDTVLRMCKALQKGPTIRLNNKQKEIAREAILCEAQRTGQTIEALAVCTNHIHLAIRPCRESIERIVNRYKHAATRALRHDGLLGRVWAVGFDKRFCFTEVDLSRRVMYIRNHESPAAGSGAKLPPSQATGLNKL